MADVPDTMMDLLRKMEARVAGFEQKLEAGGLSEAERKKLQEKIAALETEIAELKSKPAPAGSSKKEEKQDDEIW